MDTLPHEKKIVEYQETIAKFREQHKDDPLFSKEIETLEKKLEQLRRKVYAELTPWERVSICRHPARPQSSDYIEMLCSDFQELHGDRLYRDDRSIIGGLARIGSMKCVVIGQDKGHDTEGRVERNFGMLHPEGFRKALRLIQLAEKFHLPVVSLLDTPGAFPGLEAEERGQGWAIAMNLREMAHVKTPVIVIVIGEGCSGGALGMGVGDTVGMLEHAYYSVISPEGCASILWRDASRNVDAASALKLNAEDLQQFEIIDEIIPEPLGGAHHNPQAAADAVKTFILDQWEELRVVPPPILIERRYQKFRRMGSYQEPKRSKTKKA